MKTLLTLCVAFVAAITISACISEARASPPLAALNAVPASAGHNSAGNRVFATAVISDATGVVTTNVAAGTYVTVGTAAPLVLGDADGSGCITYAVATNLFTVASCGVGKLRLEACFNDVVGINAKFFLGAWHRVRSSTTTIASPILRGGTEATTAVRAQRGCVVDYVNAASGDTYDFRFDVETTANTVTTRAAHFVVEKVSSL